MSRIESFENRRECRDPGQGGGGVARRQDLAGARPHRQPRPPVRLAGGDADPQDGGAMSAVKATSSSTWRRDRELPFQKLDEETIVVDPRRPRGPPAQRDGGADLGAARDPAVARRAGDGAGRRIRRRRRTSCARRSRRWSTGFRARDCWPSAGPARHGARPRVRTRRRAEAAPRCQDELVVGAEDAYYAACASVQGKAFAQTCR